MVLYLTGECTASGAILCILFKISKGGIGGVVLRLYDAVTLHLQSRLHSIVYRYCPESIHNRRESSAAIVLTIHPECIWGSINSASF